MKRPLLWVGIFFALGEVISKSGMDVAKLIIVIIVLCYVIIKKGSKKRSVVYFLLFFVCFISGYFVERSYLRINDNQKIADGTFIEDEVKLKKVEEKKGGQELIVEIKGNIRAKIYIPYDENEKINYLPGQRLYVKGTIAHIEANTNPGGFNQSVYYAGKGIYYYIKAEEVYIKDESCYLISAFLIKLRKEMSRKIEGVMPDKEAGVMKSMILGERSGIDDEIKTLYQENGIIHILAISALHISLIATLIIGILKKTKIKRKYVNFITIGVLLLYCIMTGFSAATFRAVIMISLSIISGIKKRSYDMPSAIGAALILILIISPESIVNTGLCMSFTAAAGVFCGDYIYKKIYDRDRFLYIPLKLRKYYKIFIKNIIFSLSLNACMLPILISSYYEIPLYAMILNMIIVPLLSVAVISGFLGALIGSTLIAYPGVLILRFYEMMCRLFLKLPYSRVITGNVDKKMIAVYYIALISIIIISLNIEKKRADKNINRFHFLKMLKTEGKMLLLMGVFIISVGFINERQFKVVFLDVGQGDGCIIHIPFEGNFIVDCGSSSKKDIGKYALLPALKYYGISDVSCCFLSHIDEDHINGIRFLLENQTLQGIKVKNIAFAKGIKEDEEYLELLEIAKANKTEVKYFFNGDAIKGKRYSFNIIGPNNSCKENSLSGNDYSLVLEFLYDELYVLFTGDIGIEAEKLLLNDINKKKEKSAKERAKENNMAETIFVLKVAHHGSNYSSQKEFLEKVKFDLAVISCGKNNIYGHPGANALERLEKYVKMIKRTDKNGAIIISF